MAKDPAVLFYTSDFLTGTMLMSNEQKGKYITLLCLQHQKKTLTEKDMLNICGSYDEDIFEKFTKEEGDIFYNKRMREEQEKRVKYSESRSKNRMSLGSSKGKAEGKKEESHDEHMEDENEIESIVSYLNKVCGTSYKSSSKKTRGLIAARKKEKYSADDFKKVVDIKHKDWNMDGKMKKFLRPETLFGTKFESYLQDYIVDSKKEGNMVY